MKRTNRKNYFQYFRVRLWASILSIIAILLTLCFAAVYSMTLHTLQEQYEETASTSLYQIGGELQRFIGEVERNIAVLQLNSSIRDLVQSQTDEAVELIELRKNFIAAMDKELYKIPDVNSIMVIKNDGTLISNSATRTSISKGPHDFVDTAQYKKILTNAHRCVWGSGYDDAFFSQTPASQRRLNGSIPVVVCGRRIANAVYTAGNSVILLSIPESAFRSFLAQFQRQYPGMLVLDADGVQIMGGDAEKNGQKAEFFTELRNGDEENSFVYTIDEKKTHVISSRMSNNWYIVSTVPMQYYYDHMHGTLQYMIWIGASTLLVISIFCVVGVVRMTAPLGDMVESMNRVAEGALDTRMRTVCEVYEFNSIATHFNEMLDSIHNLLEKNIAMEKEKRRLEIDALQAQINPHFIYNTLTSMRWLATMSHADNLSGALLSLGNVLRPLFVAHKEEDWTLREELEHIGHYTALMDMRFGNRVNFQLETDEDAAEKMIPRFIIQPLLENSYEYSVSGSALVTLKLRAVMENGDLVLSVHDDGLGMDAAQLESVRLRMYEMDSSNLRGARNSGSIGLNNVYRRLLLYFGREGDAFRMTIDSVYRGYTNVEIRIYGSGGMTEL